MPTAAHTKDMLDEAISSFMKKFRKRNKVVNIYLFIPTANIVVAF